MSAPVGLEWGRGVVGVAAEFQGKERGTEVICATHDYKATN